MSTQSEVDRLLAQGVASAQAGQRAEAYNLLLDVVELDRRNEMAWLWLSTVSDRLEDQRICLENVLTINPDNTHAREQLAALPADGAPPRKASSSKVLCPQCGAGNRDFVSECQACGYAFFTRCPSCHASVLVDAQVCDRCGVSLVTTSPNVGQSSQRPDPATAGAKAVSHPSVPATLWPVVAFWVSLSLFFIGGGVASLVQFTGIVLHARGVIQNLKPMQIAWLPVGLFFLVFGFIGLSLAWQLSHRQPGGYYGSLVFGLFLVLLGPSASLVLEPPNYVATLFTGLMPAAAVLLTVASMTGFAGRTNSP